MKKNSNPVVSGKNGELMYQGLNSHIGKKYKADTPLDHSIVPYLIMVFCAVVDCAVFINLFKTISFESPFMLGVQVAGFLFAFDVVPIYIGIQLRRLRQNISKDSFILWLAIAVCVIACALNVFLRISTIDQISPDVTSTTSSYYGATVDQTADTGTDPVALALTVFGICLPMLTSLGSFFISYLTYNPLLVRQRREEEMMNLKRDEIRRIQAIIDEYDADENFAENLKLDDDAKFTSMQKMHRAAVVGYCDYVRQRLKEHLGDPASVSALSEETCNSILERLDRELAALDRAAAPTEHAEPNNKVITTASSDEAAA